MFHSSQPPQNLVQNVYIYINTYMYIYIHMNIYIYIYICKYIYVYDYLQVYGCFIRLFSIYKKKIQYRLNKIYSQKRNPPRNTPLQVHIGLVLMYIKKRHTCMRSISKSIDLFWDLYRQEMYVCGKETYVYGKETSKEP